MLPSTHATRQTAVWTHKKAQELAQALSSQLPIGQCRPSLLLVMSDPLTDSALYESAQSVNQPTNSLYNTVYNTIDSLGPCIV